MAAQVWQDQAVRADTTRALTKLRAVGDAPESTDLVAGLAPRVRAGGGAFGPLVDAVQARQAVRFTYRAATTGEVRERTVEPWKLLARRGGWVLVGRDRDRGASRSFRLSRIEGAVRTVGEPGSFAAPSAEELARRAADLGERARAHRDARDPARAGERPARPRRPGPARRARTGRADPLARAAATSCTCRSAPSGSSPRSSSGTATPSSCSPRPACGSRSCTCCAPPRRSTGGWAPMAERASDRLLRMLGMITYLDRHEGVPVEAIAEQFGVSTRQVMDDIDTLWVTGTPGYYPHDLIDFDAASYEQGVVRLTESRGMTRPLRLGAREAVALVAALRALDAALGDAHGPGAGRGPALRARQADGRHRRRRRRGGRAALGRRRPRGRRGGRDGAAARSPAAPAVRQRVRRDHGARRRPDPARHRRRALLPARVVPARGRRAAVPGGPGAVRRGARRPTRRTTRSAAGAEVFSPGAEGELVTLHLASRARWVAETTPVEAVRNLDDGSFEVDVRVVQHAWLRHLVLQVADDVLEHPAGAHRAGGRRGRRVRRCGALRGDGSDGALVLGLDGPGPRDARRARSCSAAACGAPPSRSGASSRARPTSRRSWPSGSTSCRPPRARRDTGPTLFADRDVLRARLDALREAAAGRRAEREQRHAATRLRWQALLAAEPSALHPQVTRVLSPGHRDSDGGPDVLRNISAWHVVIVLLVVVLLFGAKRLPDLAKSVGQSMKIFKNEVKDLRDDDAPHDAGRDAGRDPGRAVRRDARRRAARSSPRRSSPST